MRVAYLINQYPKVSHSFIRREILALERQGFEILRISLRGWNEELVDRADRLERQRTRYVLRDGGFVLIASVLRLLLVSPWRFLKALSLCLRLARRSRWPLLVHLIYLAEACRVTIWLQNEKMVHLHAHFGTNSAQVAMLAHMLAKIPWSFTAHGPEEFDNVDSIHLAEKIRRCSFVVAISSYGRSQLYRLVEHRYWPKIQLVFCGLESTPDITNAIRDRPRLVCVGRLSEQKGQLLLVEAVHRLARQGISTEIVLVGDGELRLPIEKLIADYDLQTNIRITGWIDGDGVRSEISAARALVLPSFAEGLPIVIMEAMAMRRPVISTFVGGIPELVVPGAHGWLVPAGDVIALTDALRACLEATAEVLDTMGESAHARVYERHTLEHNITQLGALFRVSIR